MIAPFATTHPILVADDSAVMRALLRNALSHGGFESTAVNDGRAAVAALQAASQPHILLLDWEMPGASGPEIAAWVRTQPLLASSYILIVTGKEAAADLVHALDAGADDFVRKPFIPEELMARVRAGKRVLDLQRALSGKVSDLEAALLEVKNLRGLIPICMHCHRIRSDNQEWERLEAYIEANSEASFSHSVCKECLEKHYPEEEAA